MFADDTTIFFSPEDIPTLLQILRKRTAASGLKFHQRKTQVLWLGAKEGSKDKVGNFKPVPKDETFKLLGIHYDSVGTRSPIQWDLTLEKAGGGYQ